MKQIELAKSIATKAHNGQFRWDGKTPYIMHPAAVAKSVYSSCNWQSENDERCVNAIAAAWLHDVIEDTPLTIADLRVAGINEDILTAVDLLTKSHNEDYLSYLLRLKSNPIALRVKIEDIRNNMSDLDQKKKKSMYEKYTLALHILTT